MKLKWFLSKRKVFLIIFKKMLVQIKLYTKFAPALAKGNR